jgi:large subunit ribosomal protein L22
MEVKAITRYLRISPKKARLVADIVRGLNVIEAEHQLQFIRRKASPLILKTLRSAIANAEHNFGLKKENLYIKKILINQGPTLKRWTPKAFGRVTPIRRRSSHIEIVLEEVKPTEIKIKKKEETISTQKVETIPKKENIETISVKEITPVESKIPEKTPEIFDQRRKGKRRTMQHKDKLGLKKAGGALKRIFRRKAI